MIIERSPSITFQNRITNTISGKQSDDVESKLSKSSKFTKTSKAESIMKLSQISDQNKKAFTTLNTKIEEMYN